MAVTSTNIRMHEFNPDAANPGRGGLYKLGAVAALLAVLVALADILLTFLPAGAEPPGSMTAIDWFRLFDENWFFGLRNLGLLPNVLTLFLLIPLFLALYAAHQRVNREYAALALILSLVGTAIYLSNNAAFPMWALSNKYAAATTEAQRTLLAAAGEAILARGELEDYHLAYAARADLCRRLGRVSEARADYQQALSLSKQEPERRFLERRLAGLEK